MTLLAQVSIGSHEIIDDEEIGVTIIKNMGLQSTRRTIQQWNEGAGIHWRRREDDPLKIAAQTDDGGRIDQDPLDGVEADSPARWPRRQFDSAAT